MEMRKIGKTDIQAAGLGLGCWAIGGGLDVYKRQGFHWR